MEAGHDKKISGLPTQLLDSYNVAGVFSKPSLPHSAIC